MFAKAPVGSIGFTTRFLRNYRAHPDSGRRGDLCQIHRGIGFWKRRRRNAASSKSEAWPCLMTTSSRDGTT